MWRGFADAASFSAMKLPDAEWGKSLYMSVDTR
jgi:hypothetical protein